MIIAMFFAIGGLVALEVLLILLTNDIEKLKNTNEILACRVGESAREIDKIKDEFKKFQEEEYKLAKVVRDLKDDNSNKEEI